MLSFIISFSLLIIIKNNFLTIYVFWLKLKFLYNDFCLYFNLILKNRKKNKYIYKYIYILIFNILFYFIYALLMVIILIIFEQLKNIYVFDKFWNFFKRKFILKSFILPQYFRFIFTRGIVLFIQLYYLLKDLFLPLCILFVYSKSIIII